MDSLIKIDLEKIINGDKPIIIELGCGQKKKPGRIGVDKINLPNVDIVAEITHIKDFLAYILFIIS